MNTSVVSQSSENLNPLNNTALHNRSQIQEEIKEERKESESNSVVVDRSFKI